MTLAIGFLIFAIFAAKSRRLYPLLLIFAAGSEFVGEGGAIFSYPRLAVVAALIGLLMWHRVTWPPRIFVGWMALAFAVWMCLSLTWSTFQDASLLRVVTVVSLSVQYILIVLYVREPRDMDRFWSAFLIFALVDAASSLVNLQTGKVFLESETSVRTAGLLANPNDSAFVSSLGLCVLFIGMLRSRQYKVWYGRPWTSVTLALVLLGGLLSSGSRSGALSGIAGFLSIMWFAWRVPEIRSKLREKSWIVAAGAVLGTFILFPLLMGLVTRFGEVQEDGLGGREDLFKLFVAQVPERLFIGHGLNTASTIGMVQAGTAVSTHNTYITIILEFGIVGAILCGAAAWCVFKALSPGRFGGTHFLFDRILLLSLVVANVLYAFSADQVLNKFVWLFIGVMDVAHGLRRSNDLSRCGLSAVQVRRLPRSGRALPTGSFSRPLAPPLRNPMDVPTSRL